MHKFVHSSETSQLPYQCTKCEIGFQRRDKWYKHIAKIHPHEFIDLKKGSIEIKEPKNGISEVVLKQDVEEQYVVLTSTPEIYTIQNVDGSFTQVQTLQVVDGD